MAVSGQSPPLLSDLALIEEELLWGKSLSAPKLIHRPDVTMLYAGTQKEEVLKNAAEHAKQHGIREVTPELKTKVKAAIRDEK
jgi:predicted small metal-binding protein